MFGQSSFGSGFGQSNAFGANNNNASGSLFGSNTGMNQGQQQQSTFGAPATTQSTGLFGQANQATQPSAGFGGFGQPAQQPQQTNAFGQPAPSAQGTSLFGAKSSPFGAATTNTATNPGGAFGAPAANTGMGGAGNGTAIVPFQARQEPEPSKPSHTNIYQSISAMPQYSNFSFEELRWQDYQQNRRFGDGGAGGGVTNAFGGTPSTPFNAANTSTGFGFGAGQPQQNAFGQPAAQPASNSSPFGQTNTAGTGLFGQQNQQPGQTSSPFGGQPKPAFGFGANTATNTANTGATGGLFGSTNTNNASPFGTNQNTTNTGSFGGFGQTQPQQTQQPTASFGFGAQNNNNTGGTGIFGQSNTNTGGGMFGQNQQSANTSGGLFGQQKPANSMFGTSNPTNTGFSFGQNNQANTSAGGGLFGANNTGNTATSSGIFGQKPATGFGQSTSTFGQQNNSGSGGFGFGQNQQTNQPQPAATGGLFGQNNTSTNSGGGLFGQQNNTASNNTGGGLFGQNNASSTPAFGQTNQAANTSGGLFGQAKPATTGGGLFGSTNTSGSGGGLFGNSANTSTTATGTGTGLFGSSTQPGQGAGQSTGFGQTKPATGGLFGQPASGTATTGTGLFGAQAPNSTGFGQNTASANTSSGGLFGNKPAGQTSLFGGQQANNTAATGSTTSTFGKPAGTSLFGNTTFGQPAQQPAQQTSGLGGSLFGQPAAGTGANTGAAPLFGQQQPAQFGQPGQQLVASIAQNPYGNNPLFANVPAVGAKPDEFATPLTPAQPPKRLDPLIAFKLRPRRRATSTEPSPAPAPASQIATAPPQTSSPAPSAATSSSALTVKTTENGSLYSDTTDKLILRSELFVPRSSALRRLVLDPRGDEPDAASARSIGSVGSVASVSLPDTSNVELKAAASSTPPRKTKIGDLSVSEAPIAAPLAASGSAVDSSLPDNEQVDENGYWISPSQAALDQMSVKELEAVKHFRVGRKDVGFVEFDAPVDLSGYSNARRQIAGHLIVFADRMFSLYPEDKDCPPVGQGFNVGATVTLYNLWVKAKDTNLPIKDSNNGQCKRQLKRLQAFPNTTFVSWDPETGTWVFKLSPRKAKDSTA